MNPRVKTAKPLPSHKIVIEFLNGEKKVFDVRAYLDFGVFRELRDLNYFFQVKVANGTLVWPHEQDICPDTLYEDSAFFSSEDDAA